MEKKTSIVFSWCQSGKHEECKVEYTHIRCICSDLVCQGGLHGIRATQNSMSDEDIKRTLDRVMKNNSIKTKGPDSGATVGDYELLEGKVLTDIPPLPPLPVSPSQDRWKCTKCGNISYSNKGCNCVPGTTLPLTTATKKVYSWQKDDDAPTIAELERRRLRTGL